jgi:hypothetical protein
MKPTLFLHVGMDKTGTSAVQLFLHERRDELLEKTGVLFPLTGKWTDHSHHPFAFTTLSMGDFKPSSLKGLFANLAREIKQSNAKSVLLSSECFFKMHTKDGFDLFWEKAEHLFGDIKVIVYVRRQDKWVESRHRHSIVSGNELAVDVLSRPFFSNYKQFIDKWRDLVGHGNVIVKPFERQQFVDGDVCQDFAHILGANDLEPSEGSQVNVGFSSKRILFRKLINKLNSNADDMHRLNRLLLNLPKVEDEDHPFVSPAQQVKLFNEYNSINQDLAREYIDSARADLFFDPAPTVTEGWINPALTGADIVYFVNAIHDASGDIFDILKRAVGAKKKTTTDVPMVIQKLTKALEQSD